MSSLCDSQQVIGDGALRDNEQVVGDDAQLNYKAEYVRLAKLLSDKEVYCFLFSFDLVSNIFALF
jgi:hypothetical protein